MKTKGQEFSLAVSRVMKVEFLGYYTVFTTCYISLLLTKYLVSLFFSTWYLLYFIKPLKMYYSAGALVTAFSF